MKANKKVILCKKEVTYGLDPVPVVGTDALVVLNFSVKPINIRYADRNQALPFFGNRGQINVGETMSMEFDIEIAGAGGVAAVPGYSAPMRGCAMSETITPTTGPVAYSVISAAEESVTLYFNWDGVLHKMLGAYGTMEFRFPEGNIPLNHMTFEGLYGGIAEAAAGTPVLTAFQLPKAVTKTNTTFTLHGYAASLASFTLTQGNESVYKNRPNSERMYFTNRVSKGQVTIELPLPSVKDFIGICRAETLGALSIVHGTTAGNKVLIDAPNVQLTNPSYTEDSNICMLSMDMNFRHTSAGNDEWTYKTQ